jgi:hypothetical protein
LALERIFVMLEQFTACFISKLPTTSKPDAPGWCGVYGPHLNFDAVAIEVPGPDLWLRGRSRGDPQWSLSDRDESALSFLPMLAVSVGSYAGRCYLD